MRRLTAALRALTGHLPDEYVRRSDVPDLVAQIAEAELVLATLYERANTMASRLRKQQQRWADRLQSTQTDADQDSQAQGSLDLPQPADRKQALRRRVAALRAATNGSRS